MTIARRLVGVVCIIAITSAVFTGIVFPAFGANSSWPVELFAFLAYVGMFYGMVWGFDD
jgi:hypothetical protein